MEQNLFVSLIIIISLIVGIFIGFLSFKIRNRKMNKKIIDNAGEVLNNKRKNVINIEGKEYDATKFIVRDENDVEKVIDLKGGNITQNEKSKKSVQQQNDTNPEKHSEVNGKDSRSGREKKRNLRDTRERSRRFS